MRKLHILIFFIATLCSCSRQDYPIETRQFECLAGTYAGLGVDLRQELSKFEEHLINAGVLSDKSGESYYEIYKKIEISGDVNFTFQYSFIDSIKSHCDNYEDINADCIKQAEKLKKTRKYKKSKIYQLEVAMDSILVTDNITVSNVASVILRILSPEDFENDYYRMSAILMLATTQDSYSGMSVKLPPITEEEQSEKTESRNILFVFISTCNDSVMLNNRNVSIDNLADVVKNYIISDSKDSTMPELIPKYIDLIGDCYQSKLIISLRNERDALYMTYVNVQNQLFEAYNIARNEKAIEYFGLEFNKLTTEQQTAIKELVPIRISEAEPIR